MTIRTGVDRINCVDYQIYNLNPCYCGEFYMMMSVLWSSSYDSALDIAMTIMSGVEPINCIDYQIYNLNP